MATRRSAAPAASKPLLELAMLRDEAKTRLQERIDKGVQIKQLRVETRETFDTLMNDYSKWNSFNVELLKRIFTTEELANEYDYWGVTSLSMYEPSLGERIADTFKDIDTKIHRIDSIIERLELIPLGVAANSSVPAMQSFTSQLKSKKVFIVHGHDEIAKTNLEVFLHEIGLEPVVLHRQADERDDHN